MNGFRKLQQRLREEGWYVGWNEPCCQSCAWSCLPDYFDAQYDDKGYLLFEDEEGNEIEYQDLDYTKVLFNHSQDCEVYLDGEECSACEGDGIVENPDYDTSQLAEEHDDDLDEFIDCPMCDGMGEIQEDFDSSEFDKSVDGFICNSPEQQKESMFCFDGSKKGVKNLKEILPIIEECGCKWFWDQTGDTRIEISWE